MLEQMCSLPPGLLDEFSLEEAKLTMAVEPFTWTWVLASLAAGVLSWIGSKLMDQIFGSSGDNGVFEEMVRSVERIVDLRFTQYEMAELENQTSSIVDNLRVFNNTPSISRIDIILTKIIDAENFCLSHFKDTRGVLSFRHHLMLAGLRLQAHQDRMKLLYDQGVREGRQDLINESYGEIKNIQDVLGAYKQGGDPRGEIENAWSKWNVSRFGELFKAPGLPFFYTFAGNAQNTQETDYDAAYRVRAAHINRESRQIFRDVLLPWTIKLKNPMWRQWFYLERITVAFDELRHRRPNYYELESFARLIRIETRSLDLEDWDDADQMIRDELRRSSSLDNETSNVSAIAPTL